MKSYSVPATRAAPIGSSRPSTSSRLRAGHPQHQVVDRDARQLQVRVHGEAERAPAASPMLVTSCSARSPSAPTLHRVRSRSGHG